MSERREGWYWVQMPAGMWTIALYCDGAFVSVDEIGDDENDLVIGERIPTPDEPWQCVPKEPTEEMLTEAVFSYEGGSDRYHFNLTQLLSNSYEDMLSAAPKPEDS